MAKKPNAQHLQEMQRLHEAAEKASAKARLAQAKLEMGHAKLAAQGKRVEYDWEKGPGPSKVVDVKGRK